jgi:hypothetical protein
MRSSPLHPRCRQYMCLGHDVVVVIDLKYINISSSHVQNILVCLFLLHIMFFYALLKLYGLLCNYILNFKQLPKHQNCPVRWH